MKISERKVKPGFKMTFNDKEAEYLMTIFGHIGGYNEARPLVDQIYLNLELHGVEENSDLVESEMRLK